MRSCVLSAGLIAPDSTKRTRPWVKTGGCGRAASQMASRRAVTSSTGRSLASASAMPAVMSCSYWDSSRYGLSPGGLADGASGPGPRCVCGVTGWRGGGACEHLYSQPDDGEEAYERRSLLPVVIGYVTAILVGLALPKVAVALYFGIAVFLVVPFGEVRRLLFRRS